MKKRSALSLIIYGLIALAAIGLIANLVTNTTGFLFNILLTAIFAFAIFGILYYFVFGGRNTSSEAKKYKKAVRQSKSKYTKYRATPTYQKEQPSTLKRRGKKRPSHLRVIDGNKAKRKKRASN